MGMKACWCSPSTSAKRPGFWPRGTHPSATDNSSQPVPRRRSGRVSAHPGATLLRSVNMFRTAALLLLPAMVATAQTPRARELGIAASIGGTPGALDAITDVAGVEVGHTT